MRWDWLWVELLSVGLYYLGLLLILFRADYLLCMTTMQYRATDINQVLTEIQIFLSRFSNSIQYLLRPPSNLYFSAKFNHFYLLPYLINAIQSILYLFIIPLIIYHSSLSFLIITSHYHHSSIHYTFTL